MSMIVRRGNDLVCLAIAPVAQLLVGKKTADLFADMGAAWSYLTGDPQLRWYALPDSLCISREY